MLQGVLGKAGLLSDFTRASCKILMTILGFWGCGIRVYGKGFMAQGQVKDLELVV